LEKSRKSEKTIELHEFYVIRSNSGSLPQLCAECSTGDAFMVTPEQAAPVAKVSVRVIFRWLEAGATGSYGTVIEPCNMLQKFPHPAIVIGHYLAGETLIEAYWKSVDMPGQGIFIGEPLASPFRAPAS